MRTPTFRGAGTAAEADDSKKEVKILGVCGGIGSGKSTACVLLVDELNCLAHLGRYPFAYVRTYYIHADDKMKAPCEAVDRTSL